MLTDLALIAAGCFLVAMVALRERRPRRDPPSFWDRSPDGAVFNAVAGAIVGVAAIAYGLVSLLR